MKETLKVGIGGYAFIFDVDAYQHLKNYLNKLKSYFQNKEDGAEVINDIEARMSELLLLKRDSPNYIITLSDAQDIINIMGKPSDIIEEETILENDKTASSHKKGTIPMKKKLYRDVDNAVLGGVFSGLGQYFRIDPVILRIIYLISMFVMSNMFIRSNIFDKVSAMLFIGYFILWIVVPKAQTFAQKLAMSGQDPSIEDITAGNIKTKEMRGSALGQALKKIFKVFGVILLVLIGISIILGVFFVILFPSITVYPSLRDFLETNDLYSLNINIALLLIALIPAFAIIYLVIKLLSGFKPKDIVVLGIALIIWLISCGYITLIGVDFFKSHKHEVSSTEKITSTITSDTLYVKLGDQYKYSESVFNNNELYMLDENSIKSWFLIPTIHIKKDSIYKNVEIEIKKKAFAKNWQIAEDKAQNATLPITEQGSNITIEPHIYNKNNLWNRELFNITIYCPENKEIVMDRFLKPKTRISKPPKKKEKTESSIEKQKTDTPVSIDSTSISI